MLSRLAALGNNVLSTLGTKNIDNSKDQQTAKAVGVVTLVIFSAGAYYGVQAISRGLTPKALTDQEAIDSNPLKVKELSPQDVANLNWGIQPGVKKTLDKLFEGSSYSVDTLPFYQPNDESKDIEREKMNYPIMKGSILGRRFIAIKVDSVLTDEHIEKYMPTIKETVLAISAKQRELKEILLLHQRHPDGNWKEFKWCADRGNDPTQAQFFYDSFTSMEDGSGPIESEKDNFERTKGLIKNGVGIDLRGLTWTIPKE